MKKIFNTMLFALMCAFVAINFVSCKDNDKDGVKIIDETEDELDRNYIESPYSLNSVKDFADNVRSIKNVYEGVGEAAGISEYVKAVNPSLDSKVRAAIAKSIAKIEAIPEPFITSAPGSATQTAMDATNELESLLSGDVMNSLEKEHSEKEVLLAKAMDTYVNKVVIPTYHNLTLHSTELADLCAKMLEKYDAGTLTTADIEAADKAWYAAREYWELSEAFLVGPVSDHKIDPHIDSWPLARAALQNMLNNKSQMARIEADGGKYAGSMLGPGLLGFHAVEYMIFQLTDNGTKCAPHSTSYSSRAELVYLAAVAEDLRNQVIYLEACWAGEDAMTEEQKSILNDAELEPDVTPYGNYFINAGKPGSKFVNLQAAAQEIVDGCASIADEVANTKMGTPHNAKD